MALSDLAEFLNQGVIGPFRRVPFYEPYTDTLIFYLHDKRSYHRPITRSLGLHIAFEDESLVGCEVRNVTPLLAKHRVAQHDIDIALLVAKAALEPAYRTSDLEVLKQHIPQLHELLPGFKFTIDQDHNI